MTDKTGVNDDRLNTLSARVILGLIFGTGATTGLLSAVNTHDRWTATQALAAHAAIVARSDADRQNFILRFERVSEKMADLDYRIKQIDQNHPPRELVEQAKRSAAQIQEIRLMLARAGVVEDE